MLKLSLGYNPPETAQFPPPPFLAQYKGSKSILLVSEDYDYKCYRGVRLGDLPDCEGFFVNSSIGMTVYIIKKDLIVFNKTLILAND